MRNDLKRLESTLGKIKNPLKKRKEKKAAKAKKQAEIEARSAEIKKSQEGLSGAIVTVVHNKKKPKLPKAKKKVRGGHIASAKF